MRYRLIYEISCKVQKQVHLSLLFHLESVFIFSSKCMIYYNQQETQSSKSYTKGGGYIMNDIGKGMLIILVILYIVSPIDFAPGLVDDAIVLLLGMAAAKKQNER